MTILPRARKRPGRLVMIAAALLVTASQAAAAGASDAHAPRSGRPFVRVSGPSPYARCDVPLFRDEMTFVNAEVEPWVTVDPSDPRHLVGAWQQDRHSFGGSNGLASAYSLDRGHTWHETTLPFDRCAPGGLRFERASDPWVSIGPDGTVYAISIAWNYIRNADNVVAAATSADGGATWNDPVIVHSGPSANGLGDDKESITADPVRPGVAYATWEVFKYLPARNRDDEHRVVRRSNTPAARAREITAPLWFASTTDAGATWERPQAIYEPGAGSTTLSGQIVVDPTTGALYDFFHLHKYGRGWQEVIRSTDGGATWSDPVRISRDLGIGVSHPNTGERLRVGNEVPDAAVDPRNGDLYVVWEDSRFSGGEYDEVAFSRSIDGGTTWSRPIRANTPSGLPAFTPSVEVNPHGFVGVSYYDLREVGPATNTLPTDAWLVKLRNGGRKRIGEWKLAGPFDSMTAPNAGGFFLGDYEGLAVSGTRFAVFFAVANDGSERNRTDIVSLIR